MKRIAVLLLVSLFATAAEAAPRVSFELVTEDGIPVTGAQKWIDVLKDLDQSGIRIRAGRAGDKTDVVNRGTETSPSYHVTGILRADNQLALLGGRFSLNDRAKIGQWISKLKADGIEGLTATKAAFGLTGKQLVAFHETLSKPIAFDTKGVRAGDVARTIVRGLPLKYTVTDQARKAFRLNELVLDELNGLSHGTALAAALRPLGLVLSPEKPRGGDVRLLISDVREAEESWPIGWPPEQPVRKAAPDLYEYLPVEIKDTALSEAISAIQGRIETPLLFDRNSMARQQIELAEAKVSFPRKRVQYRRVLDQVLFQGKLKTEMRVDEAGKAFLWVSPRRR
jgi:hypothetical protein